MHRKRSLILLVAAVALVAAACGSSSGGKSSGGTTAGSSSTASVGSTANGSPIKMGFICSCTGPFGANIAAAKDVAQDWTKWVNSTGGLDGHPIDLTVKDDGGNPGTSVSDMQSLISSGVDVVLDSSPLDASWASAVQSAGIPVVGGEMSSTVYGTNPDFYPSGSTLDSVGYSVAATAKSAKVSALGILYCAESPSCQESIAPTKSAGASLGLPLTYQASISATAPNYTAQCVAANQAKITGLFISDVSTVFEKVGQNCTQQGYKPTYLENGTGFTMKMAQTPGLENDMWMVFPVLPLYSTSPQVQQMNKVMNQYSPGLVSNNTEWSEFQVQMWTGGELLRAAVSASGVGASGTVDKTAILKGLNSLKGDTLGGWSPPLTFTAGQPHPVDCWFTGQVKDGKTLEANGGKATCMPSSSSSSATS